MLEAGEHHRISTSPAAGRIEPISCSPTRRFSLSSISCQIVPFGAEFTRVWAARHGVKVKAEVFAA